MSIQNTRTSLRFYGTRDLTVHRLPTRPTSFIFKPNSPAVVQNLRLRALLKDKTIDHNHLVHLHGFIARTSEYLLSSLRSNQSTSSLAVTVLPGPIETSLQNHLDFLRARRPFPTQQPTNLRNFHANLASRKQLLSAAMKVFPIEWKRRIGSDTVVGRLGNIEGGDQPLEFNPNLEPSRKISSLFLTTFPVSDVAMYSAPESTITSRSLRNPQTQKFRPAHTAYRLRAFEVITPMLAKERLWFDSNPIARGGGIGTDYHSPAQLYAFQLSMKCWSQLPYQYIHVAQAANRDWVLDSIAPTHFLAEKSMAGFGTDELVALGAEKLAPCWRWNEYWDSNADQIDNAFLITPAVLKAYLLLHTVDASKSFKYHPHAIYVQKYRGLHDQLFFFSLHPCCIDQLGYSHSNYTTAINQIEKISFSLLHLRKEDLTPVSAALLETYDRIQEDPSCQERTFLHTQFDIGGSGMIYIKSKKSGSIVKVFRELRTLELTKRVVLEYGKFSSGLKELVDYHLPDAGNPNYLPSARDLPSIICDVLVVLISYNIINMAARESRVESRKLKGGALSAERDSAYSPYFSPKFDQDVLDRFYSDPRFDEKLRAYGVSEEDRRSDHRFRIGAAKVLSNRRPVDQDLGLHTKRSLNKSSPDAIWWWSRHDKEHTNRFRAGFRSKIERKVHVRVSHPLEESHADFVVGAVCDDCRTARIPTCLMTYKEAAISGILLNQLGRDRCLETIEILTDIFKRKSVGRKLQTTSELGILAEWGEALELRVGDLEDDVQVISQVAETAYEG